MTFRLSAVVVALAMFAAACGSGGGHADDASPSSSPPARVGAALEFREVLGTLPYGKTTDTTRAGSAEPGTCRGGKIITAPTPTAQVILADAKKSTCYALGPTLLNGEHVGSATAVANQTAESWEVNVHFTNDDFVRKVAEPELNKQVAIVVDGVVESVPKINPGITGRDVSITGDFDGATARQIAAGLTPSSAPRTSQTPTTDG